MFGRSSAKGAPIHEHDTQPGPQPVHLVEVRRLGAQQ
jgi:hypothetical protein